MCKWLGALLLAVAPCCSGASVAEETVAFKGYYKTLLALSRTTFPLEERYALDLNRLRLEARGQPQEWLGFEVQYDHEALLGGFLETAQFAQLQAMPPMTYWDLEDDYVDRGSLFARHRLHRGYVRFAAPIADALVGRQRVAWGSGRFWNPTDLLNPFNPIALEREERPGVDAVLLQRNLGPLSRVSVVYAPQRDAPSSRALRYRTNFAATDVALVAGEFRGDRVVGFDVVGRVGEGGVRVEAARTRPEAGEDYTRLVAGIDYAFANTLTMTLEYYRNGQGSRDEGAYDLPRLHAGLVQNVGRRYAAAQVRYDFTPLLRSDNVLIVNTDDGSRFFAPSLVYSVTANFDWSVGVRLFGGATSSEFGSFHNLYYTYVQYFF